MNVTLKRKLLFAFIFVSLLFTIGSLLTYVNVLKISQTNQDFQEAMELRSTSLDIGRNVSLQVSSIRGFLLEGTMGNHLEGFEQANEQVTTLANSGIAMTNDADIIEKFQTILDINTQIIERSEVVFELAADDPEGAQRRAVTGVFPLGQSMDRVTQEVVVEIEQWLIAEQAATKQSEQIAMIVIGITSIIAIIVAIAFGIVISNRISKPIIQLSAAAEKVSKGDLTVQIDQSKTKDEIGILTDAFTKMTENLKLVINSISMNAQQVSASAEQLSASAEETSRASEESALSIEEVVKGSDEQMGAADKSVQALQTVSAGVQEIASSAAAISANSDGSFAHAKDGGHLVEQTVTRMTSINETVNKMDAVSKELLVQSNQIGTILRVINDIAEQTNLLALNAAIEAARAGEHGKGFSVVADEVRKLAEQSGQSVVQINQIIEKIQGQTTDTVDMMGEVKAEVELGLSITKETENKFSLIIDSLKGIKEQIDGMSTTSQHISAQTQEAHALVDNMRSLSEASSQSVLTVSASSEETLAAMQEITSSAEALTKMSEELSGIVEQFKK
ncbi:methyl-accepting chemotaxis protein [Alkalihalobacillus sp. LMS39]|uniref:methyl-accepting chemotaxis protein n=1 Tax=Alkalihalobacillus sp. LMS39 TaxID=2924032 RepID=UPI001FB4C4AB|nr:methyl-accepting chemotaxis protein [Alkalihalobacillus sp. LMS39]UOE92222.1 methyl-accepting chemotaxis protein [Alkalihalobacillus sp. LMS39]